MKKQLVNENHTISLDIEMADSWWSRFKGLMMRAPLEEGKGLYLKKTNSIHMCFMRFAIDAIYFDKEGQVVKVVTHLPPWIGISACLKAKDCLEMKAGEAERLGIQVGMKLVTRGTGD